jgi:hypothetical protein
MPRAPSPPCASKLARGRGIDPVARLKQVDQARLSAPRWPRPAPYRAACAGRRGEARDFSHLRNADHQRGEQQRHHQHEQQAQEDLPDRPGDDQRSRISGRIG